MKVDIFTFHDRVSKLVDKFRVLKSRQKEENLKETRNYLQSVFPYCPSFSQYSIEGSGKIFI